MENNYQELLDELEEKKVSVYKTTDKGFELESEYFKPYDNNVLNNALNSINAKLKNSLNSLINYLALYDAKRTESAKQAFSKNLNTVFNNCQSENDFLVIQSIFDTMASRGGIAKKDAIIYSSLIRIAKKRWQRGIAIDNKPKNSENKEVEQFREKYKQVSDLCQRVFNAPSINEDRLNDTIQQIDDIHNQFNSIYNQLTEPERTEIDDDIQKMIDSAANFKELIEEERNLWTM